MTSNYLQKNEKELEALIHAVTLYSQCIGMEFGIETCALLVMKSGDDIWLTEWNYQNQDKIRTLAKMNLQILGILVAGTIRQEKWKRKIQKEYLRRTRNYSRQNSPAETLSKDKYLGCTLVRYSGPFLKRTRDELKQMDQRTRKLMTMYKAKTTLRDYIFQERGRERTY